MTELLLQNVQKGKFNSKVPVSTEAGDLALSIFSFVEAEEIAINDAKEDDVLETVKLVLLDYQTVCVPI
jgi:hypothetical protein